MSALSSNSGTVSASGTTIQAGSTLSLTDSADQVWTINNGVVDVNGAAAGYSAGVAELLYLNGTIWQENNAGNWWNWGANTWVAGPDPVASAATSVTAPATPTIGTGTFSAANGQIIGPNGQPFVARGIDVMQGDQPSLSTLQAQFPGLNYVRLAMYSYADPSTIEPWVNSLTSAGIVVEIEDHTNSTGTDGGGSQGTIYAGSQLTNELNWYASMASAFQNNPYVWFGTDNEPSETDSSGNPDVAALSNWQQQTYQAIRNTGNNSPVLLEMNSWGAGQTGVNYVASDYAGMSNVVWDIHYYGWVSGYSTDQATVSSDLAGMVQQAQQITGASGTIPVIIGEYGNSTDGQTIDPNANQVIAAVQGSGLGNVAWAWGVQPNDALVTQGGALTAYGQQIASVIAAEAAITPSAPANPSPNDTVVKSGSSAAITDASGNTWTITAGQQVAVNGATDTTTANVIELAYVNGEVWQENTADLWWGKTAPTAAWSPSSGTATSPLPTATPKPTASPNDTVVKSGSPAAITDASGNTWTITAAQQVAVNGATDTTTANVIELAYVNGEVWQENTADLWWGKTAPTAAWSPSSGTATSPLPTATPKPTASPNDTVVKSGSPAAITDASGNKWTITAGQQVAVNGATDTTTSGVIELAYVNGEVWQENTADLWWGKTAPTAAWSPSSGTATSPLPTATPKPTASPNDTVVKSGSSAAITDASGNKWTITAGQQVAVNGATDTATANVIELAYVNGEVWQENTADLWWGKTAPTAAWSPSSGTATSPLPAPTAAPSITVTAGGTTTSVSATAAATTKVDGDTFVLASAGRVTVSLGSTPTTLRFIGMSSVALTGGSAAASVTATTGTNSFTAGAGALTVTGGSGADAYVYHAGDGALVVTDFTVAKGDALTIDSGLKAALHEASDNSGGTMLTFGSGSSIDLKGVASLPASAVHWV